MSKASEKAIIVRNAALVAARRAEAARDLYTKFLEAANEAKRAHTALLNAMEAYDGDWLEEPDGLQSAIDAAAADGEKYRHACNID